MNAAFVFTTPIRFADVGPAGIVYDPRFFHLFHLAFEELFRTLMGARAYVELLDHDRVGFPAVRAECDFTLPLRSGDTADIELTVARLGGKSVTLHDRVFRAAEPGRDRALAADGKVVSATRPRAVRRDPDPRPHPRAARRPRRESRRRRGTCRTRVNRVRRRARIPR